MSENSSSIIYRNIAIYNYIVSTMGSSKTEFFTKKQNNIASLAKAFGHPARIAIIEYLMKVETCICGDIVNELPLAQPTVSQHLSELKNAGIIKGNITGNTICYCIDEKAIEKIQAFFTLISVHLKSPKNNCC
jgi:DNA-binding transcriptional ArsR family regulator